MRFFITIFLLAIFGCSSLKPGEKNKAESSADPDGATENPEDIPEENKGKLVDEFTLTKLADAGSDADRLKMSADSKLMIESQGDLLHVEKSGLTSRFDIAEKSWGVTDAGASDVDESLFHANFLSDGWFSLQQNQVSFLDLNANAFESFELPDSMKDNHSVIGVLPGYLAYVEDGVPYIFSYNGSKASLKKFPAATLPYLAIGACGEGCLLWAWDGAQFFALSALDGAFEAVEVKIVFPEGLDVLTLAGTLNIKDSKAAFSSFFVMDKKYALYQGGQTTVSTTDPTWENVLRLSQEACIPCHGDDGFDQEAVWTGLKDEIIRRIDPKTKTEAFAMPTWETKYGKDFDDAGRNLMTAWLKGESATDGTTFGEDKTGDKTPLSGALKTLSDANCKACHPKASTVDYWQARKADAASRVTSGDMPRNRNMSDADRTAFIQLINDL